MIRVLAIDPSFTGTGIVDVSFAGPDEPVFHHISTMSTGKGFHTTTRIDHIVSAVEERINTPDLSPVDVAAIEGFAGREGNPFPKGELYGCIKLCFWRNKIPFVVVAATRRAQYFTGNGMADKEQVMEAAYKRFENVMDLTKFIHDDNQADAFTMSCVAHDGLYYLNEGVELARQRLEPWQFEMLFSKKRAYIQHGRKKIITVKGMMFRSDTYVQIPKEKY